MKHIHTDMPEAVYFAHTAVSNSMLADIYPPARFHALYIAEDRPPPKKRAGQLEGSLAHTATLEPDQFDRRYVVGPTVNRNTKIWREFVADNDGRIAIQQAQKDTAFAQAAAVRAIPDIAEVMRAGYPEVSIFWQDDGIKCRGRVDWVNDNTFEDGAILLDLKTYSSADPDEFILQCARKSYERQAAFYSDGYEAASGEDILAFVFVSVTGEYPFIASAVMLDEDSIEQGRRDYKNRLALYAECKRDNNWPGYESEIYVRRLPEWKLSI